MTVSVIDPLSQFTIQRLIPLYVAGVDISFTNSALFMVLGTVLIMGSIAFICHRQTLIPSRSQAACELLFEFIRTMINDHIGHKGQVYFPYILSLFLFILVGNLLGMLPYGFTFTSHLVVTFSLAVLVFFFITLIGILKNGVRFLRLFFPTEVPLFIAPLLIPVEIMSYLTRPISLSIRLFANMVAGHAMLKIFAAFVVILLGSSVMPLAILPFMINVILIGFEFLVAILQAYVFTVLTCIYLNNALNLH